MAKRPPAKAIATGPVPRRVFVLGAGFSYAAGFPLAWQLLTAVYKRFSPEQRKLCVDVIKYLYPYDVSTKSDEQLVADVEVEEFMSLLDMSLRFNERLPTTFLRPPKIVLLKTWLLRELSALMLEQQREAENQERVGYVNAFLTKLRGTDTIITFNWDVLLERCLRHANLRPVTGSQGLKSRDVIVLKLHGSVDWYHGQDLETTSHPDVEVVHRQLYRVSYASLLDRTAPIRPGAAPFVVPPTFFKDVQGISDLEDLWKTAFERLQHADEVHFCGYRLPPEDMYARFVLRRAIRYNGLQRRKKSQPPLKVSLVNPDRDGSVAKFLRSKLNPKVTANKKKFQDSRWARP